MPRKSKPKLAYRKGRNCRGVVKKQPPVANLKADELESSSKRKKTTTGIDIQGSQTNLAGDSRVVGTIEDQEMTNPTSSNTGSQNMTPSEVFSAASPPPALKKDKGKRKASIQTAFQPNIVVEDKYGDDDDDDLVDVRLFNELMSQRRRHFGPVAEEVPSTVVRQKKLIETDISEQDLRDAGPSKVAAAAMDEVVDDGDGNYENVDAIIDTVALQEEIDIFLADRQRELENEEIEERNVMNDMLHTRVADNRPNLGPTYLLAANNNVQVDPYLLGPFDKECAHCRALYYRCEMNTRHQFTDCCLCGKVRVDPVRTSDFFRNLYESRDGRYKKFRSNILNYNNMFQFASCQANLREFQNAGPYVYSIRGKMYHWISNVEANRRQQSYGPLYFLEPEDATAQRAENVAGREIDPNLIGEIENELRLQNPYARGYCYLRERYNIERRRVGMENMPELRLAFVSARQGRPFDLPQVNEVAVVYSDEEGAPPNTTLHVYLRDRPDTFREITLMHELSDPLLFPLLFPTGDLGWSWILKQTDNRTNLTLCKFYCFRLQYRKQVNNGTFHVLSKGTKLLQQYVVTAFVRVEANRLDFIKKNQGALRSDEHLGVVDYLYRMADAQNLQPGRQFILPSSYSLSPRARNQHYQDCLAVVAKCGAPSLFVTMTANPKWPEMQEFLAANNETDASNHPFLMARVFNCKLREFMKDIGQRYIFGKPLAWFYVIEFQKRGLPHAHILIVLHPDDRLNDPLKINQLISAELPEPGTPLHDEVVDKMMHLCVPNRCLNDRNVCGKKFPKPYSDETHVNERGHVFYRRRRDGRTAIVGRGENRQVLDNRYVVSYNAYALMKYRCHLNVDVCVSVNSLKYIFKYMFKGPDYASLVVRNDGGEVMEYNEIKSYLNLRYLAPPEAAWHLLENKMYDLSHTVQRLQVHLPNRQMVIFRPGEERIAAERNARTQLTGWFELNGTTPEARQYLYTEIPLQYTWNVPNRRWQRRQRRNANIVVRLSVIDVRLRELYYLRTLLLHVRGATCFEDVRTFNGIAYETFREACCARSLLADDQEWRRCLHEASISNMPRQLRSLFAYILVFTDVTSPIDLWREFLPHLIEDFTRRGTDEALAETRALQHVQRILDSHNLTLAQFQLPEVDLAEVPPPPPPPEGAVDELRRDNEEEVVLELIDRLNEQQRGAFDAIMSAVDDEHVAERLFVIDSPGGCGKTFLINVLAQVCEQRRLRTMMMATTGIAATLLKNGRTVHTSFQIPVPTLDNSVSRIKPNSDQGQKLRDVRLIIWDEISMANKSLLHIVDRTLRDVCNNNDRPFAGKVLLLSGDFMQCLPVVAGASRYAIVNNSVYYSHMWPLFARLPLNVNVRAELDREFSEFILSMGNNTLPTINYMTHDDLIRIPNRCLVRDKDALIEEIFGGGDGGRTFAAAADDYAHDRAILCSLNDTCKNINELILNAFPGDEVTYLSADDAVYENEDEPLFAEAHVTVELLNSMSPSSLPPHQLKLKPGMVVMLMRNLDLRNNLCNGTRLVLRTLNRTYISAEKIDSFTGRLTNELVFIPRIDLIDKETNLPFRLKRRQFPIKLSYAITINKSQGQTFDRVGIYLPRSVFSHGQLYVAFSRARNFESVRVCVEDDYLHGHVTANPDHVFTRNVVYQEVLNR